MLLKSVLFYKGFFMDNYQNNNNSNYDKNNSDYNQNEREQSSYYKDVYSSGNLNQSSESGQNYNYNPNSGGGNYDSGFSSSNNQPPKNKNYAKGLGIASMVLGIVSLVCCFVYVQIACAVTGLVLGIISKRKQNNGFAVAGIVTSSFGLAIAVVMFLSGILFKSLFEEFFDMFNDMYPDYIPDEIPGDGLPGGNFSFKRIILGVKTLLK